MTITCRRIASFLAVSLLFFHLLPGCTTFHRKAGTESVFGRNYDWDVEECLLMVNPRGLTKIANGVGFPARWTARFGSVTFNQYGREFPLGGMNEAGLVVECMWLEGTLYPAPDGRREVSELQWIQYQLDTAATVAGVIQSDREVCISPQSTAPIHFLIGDASGQSAVIEFPGGRRQVYAGTSLPVTALANSTYAESMEFWHTCQGRSGHPSFQLGNHSLQRFLQAGAGTGPAADRSGIDPVRDAFRTLEQVAVSRTVFQAVYQPGSRRLHFRSRSRPDRRWIDLPRLDFSCRQPARCLSLQAPGQGDQTGRMIPYSLQLNLAQIRRAFAATPFLRGTPDESLRRLAAYPDSCSCREIPPAPGK